MQTLKLSGGLVSAHENDKEIALAVNCAKNDNFSMETDYFWSDFIVPTHLHNAFFSSSQTRHLLISGGVFSNLPKKLLV